MLKCFQIIYFLPFVLYSKCLSAYLLLILIVYSLAHPLSEDECLRAELIVDRCHPCVGSTPTGRHDFLAGTHVTRSDIANSLQYLVDFMQNLTNIRQLAGIDYPHHPREHLLPESIISAFEQDRNELSLDQRTYVKIAAASAALKIASELNMEPFDAEKYNSYEIKSDEVLCKIVKRNHNMAINLFEQVCKVYALYPVNIRNSINRKLMFIQQAVEGSENVILELKAQWELFNIGVN